MINAAELSRWLRDELERPDAASRLDAILANSELDADLRILHLCRALMPDHDMPHVWRGRPLSERDLSATAQAALAGDDTCGQWLESLQDGRCFQFYSSFSEPVEELGRRFRHATDSYRAAWERVIERGAPGDARPPEGQALFEAVQLAFTSSARIALMSVARDQLFTAQTLLLRESWYLTFGSNVQQMSIYEIKVLQYLDRPSLMTAIQVGTLNDLGSVDHAALRRGVAVSQAQSRLIRHLVIPAGTEVLHLAAGSQYRLHPNRTLRDHCLAIMHRTLCDWRTGLRAVFSRIIPRAVTGTVACNVRLVRLSTAPERRITDEHCDEFYMMLITWEAPEGGNVVLEIDAPGVLFSAPRLRARNLAHSGRLQLFLAADTRITVRFRQSPLLPVARSLPIDICFSPCATLRNVHRAIKPYRTPLYRPSLGLYPLRKQLYHIAPRLRRVVQSLNNSGGRPIRKPKN